MQSAKQAIRKSIRKQLCLLSVEERNQKSNQACLAVQAALLSLPKVEKVGLYYPLKEELSLLPLVDWLWKRGVSTYLPHETSLQELSFALFGADTTLQRTAQGFMQPVASPLETVTCLDVLLVPLVAFDDKLHRLGRGGGFYDRLITHCQSQHPLLWGVAFDMQRVPMIPKEAWDQKLDAIFTDL